MGVRAAAALLLGSLAAGTLLLPPAFSFAAAGIIPTALLIRSTAGSDLRRAPSLLRTRPMILLGEISYCFYLTHACVLLALHQSLRLLGRERFGPSVTCFGLAASVAVAWLLHIGVERPCMRRFAEPGRVRRRRLAQAARSG
jgi:peptidoglycan/LPS O-acetylase OafA/YrhL